MEDLFGVTSPPWSLRTRRTAALITLLLAGVFAWRLAAMWPPLIVALVLAYLLSPLVSLFQRVLSVGSPEIRRTLATTLAFAVAILVVVFIVLLIVPAIVSQMDQFGDALPTLGRQISNGLDTFLNTPIQIGGQTVVPLHLFGQVDSEATFSVSDIDLVAAARQFLLPLTTPVLGALGSALNSLLSVFFVLTMVFYLMKDGPRFIQQIEMLFTEPYRNDVRTLLGRLGEIWNAYLRGQLLLSITMGTLVYLAAVILGVRSPLVLGLLSGVLEFIPNIGPFLALIPAAMFALFFPSTTIPGLEGLLFMVVVVVVWTMMQNLEAIFLVPRIMGDSLDLHPVVVIVAVIGGAALAGVLGVILAAPVVATVRLLGDYLYAKIIRSECAAAPAGESHDSERDSEEEIE